MNSNNLLVAVDELSKSQIMYLRFGLLSKISDNQRQYVLKNDLSRLDDLYNMAKSLNYRNPHPTSLFPNENEISLGKSTVLICCDSNNFTKDTDDILYQMLPIWIQEADENYCDGSTNNWGQVLIKEIEVFSNNHYLLQTIRNALTSINQLINSRSAQFARSASYMGSKANLAPYFTEIIKSFFQKNVTVFDLMCGSGAASGVFSRFWKTVASDAQIFSRMLAVVQGGGMDVNNAKNISDRVLSRAREIFHTLPNFLHISIDTENNFLSSELSEEVLNNFSDWVKNYPRINNPHIVADERFIDLIQGAKNGTSNSPVLFSAYYANLFFGVRQCAEIDCLRAAIDEITNEHQKHWALGALICAISSRAYSYGGHFAQPKLDCSDKDKIRKLAPEMLVYWGQSVSHEFFVRLNNLGTESENIKFQAQIVEGPWQEAITKTANMIDNHNVCVYLDPPYTRDEYSRYYHVLETLARYDYPDIQDKPSIPKRGEAGRFASKFSTRNTEQVEELIVEIIETCLDKNWSCIWSYSSSATASIKKIIHAFSSQEIELNIFSTDYSYKAQGKSGKKDVKEHVILIRKINVTPQPRLQS